MKRGLLLPILPLALLLAGAVSAAAQDKAGEIVKARGYGLADRASKTPAAPETVYKIASDTILTGLAELYLRDR